MVKIWLLIIFTVILVGFYRTHAAIIVHGYASEDNQFSSKSSSPPSLVEINNRIGKLLCYGLLISDSWVLSRADCVNGDYCSVNEFYRLKFGLGNIENGVEVNTTRVLVHPRYSVWRIGSRNNIALIQLPSKLILNEFIAPLHLPVISGDRTQNHSGLLTFMHFWYGDNISFGYTRVTTYLQWIHDVTLIQETPI